MEYVAGLLRADGDVGRVVTFEQGGRAFVARDGRSTYIAAAFWGAVLMSTRRPGG